MPEYDSLIQNTKRRLAHCRRRRSELHYGTLWRVLVKASAACLLTALLIFVYAAGAAKWWGAPFLLFGVAAAVSLPVACAYYTRAVLRLRKELAGLEKNMQSAAGRALLSPALPLPPETDGRTARFF